MSLFLPIHSLTWVVSTSQGSSSTNTAVSSPTRASNLSSFFGPVARGCLCIQEVNLVFNAPSGVVAQKIKPRRMTGGTMILQAFALVASLLVTKFILINKKKSSQEHKSGSHSISLPQVSDVDFIEMFTTFATTPAIIISFPNLYKDHKRKDCANAQVLGSIPGARCYCPGFSTSVPAFDCFDKYQPHPGNNGSHLWMFLWRIVVWCPEERGLHFVHTLGRQSTTLKIDAIPSFVWNEVVCDKGRVARFV